LRVAQPKSDLRVSLLAISDTYMSCLSGLLDTLTVARDVADGPIPFELEIVASRPQVAIGRTKMPILAHRTLDMVDRTDIVIIPASVMDGESWSTGRYPEEVRWLKAMRSRGAILCSACSGALLLAETGLLDGQDVTTHWTLERTFRENFPEVRLRLERELLISSDGTLVMSGASTAWHDLALYLVSRFSGPATARSVAKFFMLQWHADGQTPYIPFEEPTGHGDRAVMAAQSWLQAHWSDPSPVEVMIARSGLSARNFARRFQKATGHAPLAYVQHMRIEHAKQMLETGTDPIDEISAAVGYEDASFFRRIFKRNVGLRPVDYRRRFAPSRMPGDASDPYRETEGTCSAT
jgi:transcriptional regulator GlxA family with amidase domain